jgi:hypothetical protein
VACDPAAGTACAADGLHLCNSDGSLGELTQPCAGSCHGGACDDPCSDPAVADSSLGCEFWAVDLDNAVEVLRAPTGGSCQYGAPQSLATCWINDAVFGLCDFPEDCSASAGSVCQTREVCAMDSQREPFAILVANPDESAAVTLTLSDSAGTSRTVELPPGAAQMLMPYELGFQDASIDQSGISARAFRLTASRPVAAWQYNSLGDPVRFSSGASLLLPSHRLDAAYSVVTYPTLTRRPQHQDFNGYLTIVAIRPGLTAVEVTATTGVRAGQGVAALAAGVPRSFTLDSHQALTLQAEAGGDLSGSMILGDQPVAVFAGHEAAAIATPGKPDSCCADHLEEQLPPASVWGTHHVVARSQARLVGGALVDAPDLVRIVAGTDGTGVTIDPAPATGCPQLGAGQFCEFYAAGDVEIRSSEPVLVAHLLASIVDGGSTDLATAGDPALSWVAPVSQHLERYTLAVPAQFPANYLSIAAPAGARVSLDGGDVTAQLSAVGSGGFKAGRLPLAPGRHQVVCPGGCWVELAGYGDTTAYLTAGGSGLQRRAGR